MSRKRNIGVKSPFEDKYDFLYVVRGLMKVDCNSNVKVYLTKKKSEVLNGLPLRSKELFLWLITKIQNSDDTFLLDPKKYMEEMGITSQPTVRKAITGLIEAEIIAKADIRGAYFVNALYLFRGSRVNKWPEKSVIWKDKIPKNQQTND